MKPPDELSQLTQIPNSNQASHASKTRDLADDVCHAILTWCGGGRLHGRLLCSSCLKITSTNMD